MIDTIVLRIHDLKKNQKIVELLRLHSNGTALYDIKNPHKEYFNSDTGEVYEKLNPYQQIKLLEYSDSGKTQIFYKDKILTSSHYYLGYQIRSDRDYIEFNFSIPKLVYGTNLIQFVPHEMECTRFYARYQLEERKYIQSITYERLIHFIRTFLNIYFPSQGNFKGIDLNDVEINRLDICYNQHFNSKKDALKYLEYQKKIRKKYMSSKSKNKTDWETSIFLTTERYSAKIYHKGSEYKSSNGERKHHHKINMDKKRDVFHIENKYDKKGKLIYEGLQGYADRILRYEISFRNAMMSHLYRKKIFAKKCGIFRELRQNFKHVDSIKKKCDRLADKRVKNPFLEYLKLSKELKNNYKLYKSIMSKTVSFRLEVPRKTKRANASLNGMQFSKKYTASLAGEANFSKTLLSEMFRDFNSFVNQFKIETIESLSNAGKIVAKYNKDVKYYNQYIADGFYDKKKSRINANKINQIIMLMQTHSFDELVNNGIISRATKYNYIKTLKTLGLKPNQLAMEDVEVQTKTDFEAYFEYTISGFCGIFDLLLNNRYFQ